MTHLAHHPIFALSGQLVARALRVFENRRQVTQLWTLSDEALKDIGLTRSDVRRARALPLHKDPAIFLKQMACGHGASTWPIAANTSLKTLGARPSLVSSQTEVAA